MKTIRVGRRMAERMLKWLEQNGVEHGDDVDTIEDLIQIVKAPYVVYEQWPRQEIDRFSTLEEARQFINKHPEQFVSPLIVRESS